MLAPSADAATIELACEQVLEAVDDYRQSFLESVGDHKIGIGVASTRRELRDLHNTVKKLQRLLANISKAATMKFLHVRGPLEKALNNADLALQVGLDSLIGMDGYQGDIHAPALAYRIRTILSGTLGLKISMSADDERISDKGRGANYARLLRLALISAGAKPATDLRLLMKQGRKD